MTKKAGRPPAGQADGPKKNILHSNSTTTPTSASIRDPTEEEWVKQFHPRKRSQLALLMRFAARGRKGTNSPAATLRSFLSKIMQRQELRHVLAAVQADPEGALRYAQAVIDEELLPAEERERLRAARAEPYKRAHMERQAPTERQIACLRRLGYHGAVPQNRLAVSQLIDQLKQGGRGV